MSEVLRSPLLLQGQGTLGQFGQVLGVFFFNLYPETEEQTTGSSSLILPFKNRARVCGLRRYGGPRGTVPRGNA